MTILVVNAGSSSLRLAAFRSAAELPLVAADHVRTPAEAEPAVVRDFVGRHRLDPVRAVVHRVVHGGARFHQPVRIDAEVEAEIERLCALAPLHNPMALAWIRAARAALPPGTAEMAAFDTAFYAQLPEVASSYALPESLCREHGIRRYGFHGLAHQSMLEAWTAAGGAADARVISLQLGSGCSITASRSGRPLDTSMGFSPLEGLMMATRSGDLDPSVVLYLLEHGGFDVAGLSELLNRRSGLLGVSGIASSMSTLIESADPAAQRAIDLFCHRARKYVGAYLAVLGGVDAILFGGGIGEHVPLIRARVLADLEWAGIVIDPDANRQVTSGSGPIDHPDSRVAVQVVAVDEMSLMARAARALLTAP